VNVVLLVNEASGSGTDAGELEAALRAEGADVRRLPLDRSGEAVAAGPERVVVAGGDGSIASAADAAGALGVPSGWSRGAPRTTSRGGWRCRTSPARPAGWR